MSVVQPAAGLVIGGKYRLLERVGVGGMSEVYRAENLLIGRVVALKLLHAEQASDPQLSARFFQEAQSVSRIRHPGIVDVLDAGAGETGPFIVMEYLQGESAARVLARQGKIAPVVAIATMLPVLDALQAAHDNGIVHRDLKPENVFYAVNDSGETEVKLLDFGIAKLLWPIGPTPRTSTGVVFGTPDYLSPEQASGEPVLDGRSDLFSAGVVLFELLTNVRPFHAPTAVATAYRVAHARAPLVSQHGGPDEPTLDAILGRALQKRAEERYSKASEFAAELRTLLRGSDPVAALRSLGLAELFANASSAEPNSPARAPRAASPPFGINTRGTMPAGTASPFLGVPSGPSNASHTDQATPESGQSQTLQSATPVEGRRSQTLRSPTPVDGRRPPSAQASPPEGRRPQTVPSSRPDGTFAPALGSRTPVELRHANKTPRRLDTGQRVSLALRDTERVTPGSLAPSSARGVRFLPARFAGNRHARGMLLRTVDSYLARKYPSERARVLEGLSEEHAREFRHGTLQAIVYYDLESITAYLELAEGCLKGSDPAWCRAAGAAAIEGELGAVMRTALRPGKPVDVLRRLVPVMSRLFDFGRWEVTAPAASVVTLRISDFDPVSLGLRHFLLGVLDAALKVCGRLQITVVRGDVAFAPQLVLDVTSSRVL